MEPAENKRSPSRPHSGCAAEPTQPTIAWPQSPLSLLLDQKCQEPHLAGERSAVCFLSLRRDESRGDGAGAEDAPTDFVQIHRIPRSIVLCVALSISLLLTLFSKFAAMVCRPEAKPNPAKLP